MDQRTLVELEGHLLAAAEGFEAMELSPVAPLSRHIRTLVTSLERLEDPGYAFPRRRNTVLATEERASLGDRLAEAFPSIEVERERLEHPYYDGLRFMLWARTSAGAESPLADGGIFDWLGQLASNKKLALIASGMGSQLAADLFRE